MNVIDVIMPDLNGKKGCNEPTCDLRDGTHVPGESSSYYRCAAMKPSEALKVHRTKLREIVTRHGALRPRVFGSAINGDDTDGSDLDLLVDPTPRTTLMTLVAIQLEAESLLGVHVDVLTPKSLPQRFRERVLHEAVPV